MRLNRWLWAVTIVALGVLGLLWWSTAASTSVARIAALQVVEGYAFGVYHQVVHNLAFDGQVSQTIHQGYDDSWTWSGHRAPILLPVAWLYRLAPTVYGLAQIQLLLVLLGALPAAALGHRVARHPLGALAGGGLYLLSPPLLALALQDYQDLVMAIPCTVFAVWAFHARAPWLAPLALVVGLLPREETVPVVLAVAALTWPVRLSADQPLRWRRWLWNIGWAAGLVAGYLWWVETAFPTDETQYRTPLVSVLENLGRTGFVHLDGWPFWGRFYVWLVLPLGALAALSPNLLLPALGLIAFHMALPNGHAIDRSWSGHCHHLAPAVGLLVAAAVEGSGRLLQLVQRVERPPLRHGLTAALVVALLGLAGHRFAAHAADQNMRVTLLPTSPAWVHPAWGLIEQVPRDARVAVPRDLAILASDRKGALSYDGSLDSKEREKGLAAVTFAVIDARQAEGRVAGWVRRMPQAELVDEAGPFALWTWPEADTDPSWEALRDARIRKEQPWLHPYQRRQDIPGVPPFEPPQSGKGPVPRIKVPSWLANRGGGAAPSRGRR